MNEIVAQFIEKQKALQEKKRQEQKRKHLLKLGLVDSKSAEKKYCGEMSESDRIQYGYQYHDDQGYFRYEGIPKVLNVSDEDYEEICKICPPESIVEKNKEVEKRGKELLDKVDSIRRMIKFFVILTIISLVLSLIVVLINL